MQATLITSNKQQEFINALSSMIKIQDQQLLLFSLIENGFQIYQQ